MTINQFKYLIYRLFDERDIDSMCFEESTYADDSLRPTDFVNHNDGYILSVYIDDGGNVCYSVDEKGFLFQHKIDDLTAGSFKVFTFLSALFNNVYDYISSEEDDGDIIQFIKSSFNKRNIISLVDKKIPYIDGHLTEYELVVYVENGDWKHDHQFLIYKLGCMGFELIHKEDEPSDSDCYTATHYYRIP